MKLSGSFLLFTERVMGAVKLGKLPKDDVDKLSRLFLRTRKRNIILAKGILSAFNVGGASQTDIAKFSKLLQKANDRILQGKEPFLENDKIELLEIFKRAYISTKAARWFATQLDELLAIEIEEFIKGKITANLSPKRIVGFEEKKIKA